MATGIAVLDFGTFPGKSDTSVAVTGQTSIVTLSYVEAWIRPIASADHSADEHMLETIQLFAGNIVGGTGFTIYGFNTSELSEPIDRTSNIGGVGTRISGQFNVYWAWA